MQKINNNIKFKIMEDEKKIGVELNDEQLADVAGGSSGCSQYHKQADCVANGCDWRRRIPWRGCYVYPGQ